MTETRISRGDRNDDFVDFGTKGTEGLNMTKVLLFELFSEFEIMLLMVETKLDAVILDFEEKGLRRALISSTLERGVSLLELIFV